jgi:hypothetical protein
VQAQVQLQHQVLHAAQLRHQLLLLGVHRGSWRRRTGLGLVEEALGVISDQVGGDEELLFVLVVRLTPIERGKSKNQKQK